MINYFKSMDTKDRIALICCAILGGSVTYFSLVALKKRFQTKHLLEKIRIKRLERNQQISELRLSLQGKNLEVRSGRMVSLSFDDLRSQLQNGQLRVLEVLEAFQWRALQAHDQTNCVCEFLLEATEMASDLDKKYNDPDAKKPPLFGIPVSIKESNRLIGHDATIGFAQYIGHPCHDDSSLVKILKALGAVPFVTTNIPQSMLSIGSSNPVYGVTTNPHDKTRSSGGSSSGEGALIASRGSPLGIGTDVGGSVRVPAHWCGVCALKPSVTRLAQGGRRGAMPGQTSVKGTAGPMGPDVDSLVWFMRAVCDDVSFNLDPYVVPYPFNEKLYNSNQSLTIGYYDYDGWMQAVPACRRAVDVARQVLESRGHKLVKVNLPFTGTEMRQLLAAYTAALVPDGGQYLSDICSDDIIDPLHLDLMKLFSQPNWYRRLKSNIYNLIGSKRSAAITGGFASNTTDQRAVFSDIDVYRNRFDQFWQHHKLDAMICPALASVALPPEFPPKLFVILWSYCALYNLLDYSAGVVPCTHVTQNDEDQATKGDHRKDQDDWISGLIRMHSKGTAGLPVGVQCVALPFREEICLRLMKEIETGVNEKQF